MIDNYSVAINKIYLSEMEDSKRIPIFVRNNIKDHVRPLRLKDLKPNNELKPIKHIIVYPFKSGKKHILEINKKQEYKELEKYFDDDYIEEELYDFDTEETYEMEVEDDE